MELAVVSHGTGDVRDPRHVDRLAARLIGGEWSCVHGGPTEGTVTSDLARVLAVPRTLDERIELDRLIDDNPGKQLIAVASAEAIRALVASVMEVDVVSIPLPAALSLTRIQASRKGTRTVLCFNDTVHLLEHPVGDHASTREGTPRRG